MGMDGEVAHGDVVITTTADTSPARCRQLVEEGARVVVLAANRTEASESRFLLAGAERYLEMSADASPLVDAVSALTSPVGGVPTTPVDRRQSLPQPFSLQAHRKAGSLRTPG